MRDFFIDGMVCGSCVGKIQKALDDNGVKGAVVRLEPPQLQITEDGPVDVGALRAVVGSVGPYVIRPYVAPAAEITKAPVDSQQPPERLLPLFIIVGFIVGGVVLRSIISGEWSPQVLMENFMGGFFVVFALFKLINLRGFAEAYATYDIIAARSRAYALGYPFLEVALGIAYFTGALPLLTNGVTAVVMTVGAIGVYRALRSNRRFQCACLGTALSLPMTKVTLAEDLLMGLMALGMFLHLVG